MQIRRLLFCTSVLCFEALFTFSFTTNKINKQQCPDDIADIQMNPVGVPQPLSRAPRTDLAVHMEELDARAFGAIDTVVAKLREAITQSNSLDELRLLTTKAHMLLAMKGTHRSIRRLIARDQAALDLGVDAFREMFSGAAARGQTATLVQALSEERLEGFREEILSRSASPGAS
jgi:hypothetical protein